MPAPWAVILMLAAAPAFVAEQNGVRVRVEVNSNLYTWTVENLSAEPITRFAIEVVNCHSYQGPEGWELDGPVPTGTFRAWCNDPQHALMPGQTGCFTARFTSRGAALGAGPLAIGLANAMSIEIPAAWRPVHEPASSVMIAPIAIGVMALLHTLVARRRISRA